jgi:spermidine/putrescine transport system ATP-binding protein
MSADPGVSSNGRAAEPMIVLDRVSKSFADVRAVDDVSLKIAAGEFFSLLGPSGCGKTTTLRMIAGFEEPDLGRILLEGADVTLTPPPKRNVNMVFQDYALFPHMTVAENVAFGLKLKRVAGAEARRRAGRMLATMQLGGLEDRRPAELSGGQRQRVALARALVNEPAALLLDEPLGALDLKLRKEMQLELKSVQRVTGTTFVYVTHDQEEALTMSDRIAVMSGGVVEQVAAPRDLYEFPGTRFVADFIGVSNLLELRVDRREAGLVTMELGEEMRVTAPDPGQGESHTITVRPEKIRIGDPPGGGTGSLVRGRVTKQVYLGSITQIVVELQTGDELAVHLLNDDRAPEAIAPGDEVVLSWPAHHSFVIGSGVEPPATVPEPESPKAELA